MSDSQQTFLYQVYLDLASWGLVWQNADYQAHHGNPINRDHWKAVRWQAEQKLKKCELALGGRLPSGVYHHPRTERKG